jgi:predicted O-methyltransferase YrrM
LKHGRTNIAGLATSTRGILASKPAVAAIEVPSRLTQARGNASPSEADIDIDGVAYGFMASQALFSALELELFDHIAAKGGPASIEDLKTATGIQEPRLQILVNALTAMKSLYRTPDGGYTLSPNTEKFLVRSAKYFYGDYLRLQMGQQFYKHMSALPEIMKTGEGPTYAKLFSNPEEADTYTKAQHNGSLATAKALCKKVDFSGMKSLLDIGGGSGAFSIMICRKNAGMSARILEFPEVCNTGEKFVAAEEADVASRVKYIRGSCLDEWPAELGEKHDVVLISYVSESVPHTAVPMMYERAFSRLRPGGLLIVHSFMVDDTLDGPLNGALWSLQHVAVNANGLGLHPANVGALMSKAGFGSIESSEMIGGMTKLVIGKKPA